MERHFKDVMELAREFVEMCDESRPWERCINNEQKPDPERYMDQHVCFIRIENGSAGEQFVDMFVERFGMHHGGFFPSLRYVLSGCWELKILFNRRKAAENN